MVGFNLIFFAVGFGLWCVHGLICFFTFGCNLERGGLKFI